MRFTCEVNTTSEDQLIYIWNSIGVKAAVGQIQTHNQRIRFYAEVSEDQKQYPKKFKELIEERGIKVLGVVNPCGAGVSRAAAAYLSVTQSKGKLVYYKQENFNQGVIKHAQKKTDSKDSNTDEDCNEPSAGNKHHNTDDCETPKLKKQKRLLETDMIPSSFNPKCQKQQRAARLKDPTSTECQPSTQPSERLSDNQEDGDNTHLADYNPLGNIAEQYASDSEEPMQSSDTMLTTLIIDESSKDSDDSTLHMMAQLKPEQRLLLAIQEKKAKKREKKRYENFNNRLIEVKELSKEAKENSKEAKENTIKLLEEKDAVDFLVAQNLSQMDEISDHKQKRDSQEGKTAVQTKVANKAIQREIKAQGESAVAKSNAKREKQLREKAEAEKSMLLNTNASLSTVLAIASTGDQVCIIFSSTYVKCLTNSPQLENWLSKNGYSHLKEFVSHLNTRDISSPPTSRSLQGVAPALPFSDRAFRRYYDHCLAYTDFKEASKSDNKHRLYLGLLGEAPYPEAVIYHNRERLLDQADVLCEILGKPQLSVDALLPPIQGDPFDLEEVFLFIYSKIHSY